MQHLHAAPRAISLDLDDTLWPIWPVIEQAEQALHDFLCERCPKTAAAFPIARMRELRARIAAEHPQFAHDFTHQRKLSLAHALHSVGEDATHLEDAFTTFHAARNRVEFYPDALAALERLTARWPVAALTNGNADLVAIGIAHHFNVCVTAREAGHAKPDAPIFHAACERLGVAPHELLHVGDDPWLDIHGAHAAGIRTCWINRRNEPWPEAFSPPDLQFDTLAELADWLDAHHPHPETECP
jgi:FMN hydrolase / 5-amino-6-(5-phospho-D-ribitylamino)uracil phosphatase